MDVKIKDRKKNVELVRMAMNMSEVGIDYPQADLIVRVSGRLNKLKGKFSLEDGIEIHSQWKQHWEDYFENLQKELKEKLK